jgi:hypothetical protein
MVQVLADTLQKGQKVCFTVVCGMLRHVCQLARSVGRWAVSQSHQSNNPSIQRHGHLHKTTSISRRDLIPFCYLLMGHYLASYGTSPCLVVPHLASHAQAGRNPHSPTAVTPVMLAPGGDWRSVRETRHTPSKRLFLSVLHAASNSSLLFDSSFSCCLCRPCAGSTYLGTCLGHTTYGTGT